MKEFEDGLVVDVSVQMIKDYLDTLDDDESRESYITEREVGEVALTGFLRWATGNRESPKNLLDELSDW